MALVCLAILATTQLTMGVARASDTPGGGLAVTTGDPAGTLLVGTCFELYTAREDGTLGKLVDGSKRCDQARDSARGSGDGSADGSTSWPNLAPGGYFIRETLPPALAGTAATYELAPDTAFTISAGQVTPLRLVHRPTAGLTLHKVDAAGKPLPGACFRLTDARARVAASACDGTVGATGDWPAGDGLADGLLLFTALAPTGGSTTYTLREIVAPPGYTPAPDRQVVVEPGHVTEGTIANTTSGAVATGGKPIIGLELEIDSTIGITKMQAMPAEDKSSRTSASGRIALTGDESAGWHGSGTLASSTNVSVAMQCASITITGEGAYDWTVFDVHAGPTVGADAITVDMDAGQVVENPDTSVFDACGTPTESPTNTWENLFFAAYSPGHYKARGYRIDQWRAVGGPEAWTTGGVIAEATWTGTCPTLFDTQAC
ncbi:MAG: MSCRAMM family protein, partial [bacterium]